MGPNPMTKSVLRNPPGAPYYGVDAADAHGGKRVDPTRHILVDRRRLMQARAAAKVKRPASDTGKLTLIAALAGVLMCRAEQISPIATEGQG